MAEKLTGNKRYRVNWRNKLILQLEYELVYFKDLNGTGYYDTYETTCWRDARPEDMVIKE